MLDEQGIPNRWSLVDFEEAVDILDNRREPISSDEREKRTSGIKQSELYPYYGAGGQIGWIDDYIFDDNLILLAEDGATTGYVYIIDGKSWINNHAHVLKEKPEIVKRMYLFYYLKHYNFDHLKTGGTRPKLTQTNMKKVKIPVPPLDEQERIVEAVEERLERVERLKKSVENVSRLAQEYDESLVLSLMSGGVESQASIPPKGSDLPDNWKVVKMKDVSRVETGGTPKTSVDEYWGGDITWIRVSDMPEGIYVADSDDKITEKGLHEGSCSLIEEGGVVLSTRATIGEVAIAKEELATNQGFKSIIPESNLKSKYLAYYLDSITDYLESLGKGATYDEINKTQIQNLKIPLPPVEKQERIISRIESFDSERLRLAVDSVDELFSEYEESVLSYAFRGEIDC